jgi:hypothetical protein
VVYSESSAIIKKVSCDDNFLVVAVNFKLNFFIVSKFLVKEKIPENGKKKGN